MSGTLFVVGTPIGNLEDVTDRARRVLGSVGLVACEDTRRTGRFLAALGIHARLMSFFEGNEADRVPQVLAELRSGTDVALVSDAGMPGVSDPGYRLVSACVAGGIPIDVVPGPSAAIAALVVSGLPTDRFAFEGFLPRTGRKRAERLDALAGETRTTVLFESARRTVATLEDLHSTCGDRRIAVCRELTKLHQEVIRGTLEEVMSSLVGRDLKGEVVLVLEGASAETGRGADPVELARTLVGQGLRKREAARRAAVATGGSAREIYQALIEPR